MAPGGTEIEIPSSRRYSWFNDAPVYSVDDFEDFWKRLRWDRLSWWTFHHVAYLCYKSAVHGWRAIRSSYYHPTYNSEAQRLAVPNHTFLWSRSIDRDRLLRFHLDSPWVLGPKGKPRRVDSFGRSTPKGECIERAMKEGYNGEKILELGKRLH